MKLKCLLGNHELRTVHIFNDKSIHRCDYCSYEIVTNNNKYAEARCGDTVCGSLNGKPEYRLSPKKWPYCMNSMRRAETCLTCSNWMKGYINE